MISVDILIGNSPVSYRLRSHSLQMNSLNLVRAGTISKRPSAQYSEDHHDFWDNEKISLKEMIKGFSQVFRHWLIDDQQKINVTLRFQPISNNRTVQVKPFYFIRKDITAKFGDNNYLLLLVKFQTSVANHAQ